PRPKDHERMKDGQTHRSTVFEFRRSGARFPGIVLGLRLRCTTGAVSSGILRCRRVLLKSRARGLYLQESRAELAGSWKKSLRKKVRPEEKLGAELWGSDT